MKTALKAALATFLTFLFIIGLAHIEMQYTHGAITVCIMVAVLILAVFLMFYVVLDEWRW